MQRILLINETVSWEYVRAFYLPEATVATAPSQKEIYKNLRCFLIPNLYNNNILSGQFRKGGRQSFPKLVILGNHYYQGGISFPPSPTLTK